MNFPLEGRLSLIGSRKAYRVLFVLTVLMVLLVFAFSAMPQQVSSDQSSWVRDWLAFVTGLDLDEGFVRKLAHFAEYSVLGFLAGSALAQLTWRRREAVLLWLSGFGVAFLDESIQMLTDRGPAIADVWLDALGFLFGLVVSLLLVGALLRARAAKQKNRPSPVNE